MTSTESGALDQTPYSFKSRFGFEKGTNPEELIAAAHAGSFTMQLALQLRKAGFWSIELSTEVSVQLESEGESFRISRSSLMLRAIVPNITEARFGDIANDAIQNCPVSRAFKADISLEATLVSGELQ